MFSPIKVALFALLSFAAVAVAIPTPEPRQVDVKVLISNTNVQLQRAMLPITFVTSANATAEFVAPCLGEVVVLVNGLIDGIRGSGLTGCGCTSHEVLVLIAATLEIIFGSLGLACAKYSGLLSLVGELVACVVVLIQVVLEIVGGLVADLLVLLIGNGCAGIFLRLKFLPLVNCLGLGGLLGYLL